MPTVSTPDAPALDPAAEALHAYRDTVWKMHDLARKLEKIDNLPPLYGALAACLIKLSGLRPHRINLDAGPSDASALRDDLEALILSVDPVIEAYGVESCASFHGIDKRHFENVLRDSLEGFAFYDLEEAARRVRFDRAEHREHGSRMPMERV